MGVGVAVGGGVGDGVGVAVSVAVAVGVADGENALAIEQPDSAKMTIMMRIKVDMEYRFIRPLLVGSFSVNYIR